MGPQACDGRSRLHAGTPTGHRFAACTWEISSTKHPSPEIPARTKTAASLTLLNRCDGTPLLARPQETERACRRLERSGTAMPARRCSRQASRAPCCTAGSRRRRSSKRRLRSWPACLESPTPSQPSAAARQASPGFTFPAALEHPRTSPIRAPPFPQKRTMLFAPATCRHPPAARPTRHFRKFITSDTIVSFSSGRDSAIMRATATSVLSAMRLSSPLNRRPLRSRK